MLFSTVTHLPDSHLSTSRKIGQTQIESGVGPLPLRAEAADKSKKPPKGRTNNPPSNKLLPDRPSQAIPTSPPHNPLKPPNFEDQSLRSSSHKTVVVMEGQTQISSPPFSANPSTDSITPRQLPHYTPIRPDVSSSTADVSGQDGYDSNRSPSGSATMGDTGGAKRRKVNHGKFYHPQDRWGIAN